MARCSCATSDTPTGSCTCLLEAGANITLTGSGQAGDPWVVAAEDSFIDKVIYTTVGVTVFDPATFPTARIARVRAVGGGGGSASTGATIAAQGIARGGGSGGVYTEGWVLMSSIVGTANVTVGAGGIAGSPAGTPTAGGTGGQSSFGTFVVAPGGLGSGVATAPGVPPLVSAGAAAPVASPAAGVVSIAGQAGNAGFLAAVGSRFGGKGGAAPELSVGGLTNHLLGVGAAGTLYGTGGSGSVSDGVGAGQLGAAGAQGIVIVELFS